MADAQLASLDLALHLYGKPQQAQKIRNRSTVLARALRDLLVRHLEFAAQTLEGARLLYRVQVGALKILDDGHLHRLLIRELAHSCRHHLLAGSYRRPPAPL